MTVPRNPNIRAQQHERLDRVVRLLSRSMAVVLMAMICAAWMSRAERRSIAKAAASSTPGNVPSRESGSSAASPRLVADGDYLSELVDSRHEALNEYHGSGERGHGTQGQAALRGSVDVLAVATEKEHKEGIAPMDESAVASSQRKPESESDEKGNPISSVSISSSPLPDAMKSGGNYTTNDHVGPHSNITIIHTKNQTKAQAVMKEWVGKVKNATKPDADATGEVISRMKTTKTTMLVP
uniref:Uncharacterized protein n=1 Tax=Trieres chinensis TaxID=1514140 RepID=A0A7S1ZFI2_TRICV|mmetsp:Transcript_24593/g.49821  ORF Transcript_24593/g.49821 Transcript_24593/m.49821 type:complete len:240 (+) Transcript_24593:62-781(+)